MKRVRVSSDVLITLKDVPEFSYTNRLDSLIQYVEEWENEERECQYSEYLALQEEKERRYYENEGYRDAFDGDPDAY